MANCCCLVTETCEGFEPLVPGKHFVMAKTDDLITCCEYYLNHEDEREAIAEAAHNFVHDSFSAGRKLPSIPAATNERLPERQWRDRIDFEPG